MKHLSDAYLEKAEKVGLAGMDAMLAALAYQGDNRMYLEKGKLGAIGATAYVKLRATETNRMMVEEAVERRQLLGVRA